MVGRRRRGRSGRRSSSSSTCGSPPAATTVLGDARDAGRGVVSRRAGVATPSTYSAARTTTRWRSSIASEVRPELASGRGAAAIGRLRGSPRDCGRSASRRVIASSPTCRTSPRRSACFLACASIGAVWSSAAPGVRRPQRDRPLRPDRAQGAAGDRRLPLRRQGLRSRARSCERIAAEIPGFSTRCASATSTGRGGRTDSSVARMRRWSSRRCRSTIRCGCSTARARPGCPSRSSTARAGS